nr:sodium/potassium/calcium exchanger 3-like [Leptinotarsa decemlineata]XP_023014269.1 sodium/potassium/calcium exchanger 3-like [Leptinotarsa decemlineata]
MRTCCFVIFCASLLFCVSSLTADHSAGNDVESDVPQRHRIFIPFARPLRTENATNQNKSCSDDDFPDFLSEDQVKQGGFVLVILIGVYGFTLLAVVCDKYFLPCVETICEVLNLSPDVAAATFMSIATSTPELFTNIIGTFITESDIGIGTIVGSSMFNGLGVAAIGSLAAPFPLQLDWWPITRDVCLYSVSVSALVIISWDENIFWYEALVLMIIYVIYFTIMSQNRRISKFIRSKFNVNKEQAAQTVEENPTTVPDGRLSIISAYGSYLDDVNKPGYVAEHIKTLEKLQEEEKAEASKSLFRKPEGSLFHKIIFYYTWPIQVVLRYTVPNPKIYPKLFPITFVMCIVWIGLNSYVVAWMISIIGALVGLSDAVMGMTLLAAGSSLPESISMAIIARRGEGAFGVSNSLGANTMNILYSLGMPWFIKNLVDGASTARPVKIHSGSIEYTILSLIFVSFCLFTTLACNKFRLSKCTGVVLITIYVTMVVLAILSETVFFDNDGC